MTYAHFQTSTKVQKHAQQSEPTLKLTKAVSQTFFSGSLKPHAIWTNQQLKCFIDILLPRTANNF
jgi:hypothetical protein